MITPYDVMVDIETLGTDSDAAIVSIGAVLFNTKGIKQTFYRKVCAKSSVEAGGTITGDTVIWWLKQPEEARKEIYSGVTSIEEALADLDVFLKGCDTVWACGNAFDNAILRNAYKRLGKENHSLSFWKDRDFRTVRELFPQITHERKGVHHNALNDAVHQAEHLIKILNHIEVNL